MKKFLSGLATFLGILSFFFAGGGAWVQAIYLMLLSVGVKLKSHDHDE